MRTELDWLALVLATESDRPSDYPYLAIPILNRVDDTEREFIKLKTVAAVVRQPKAFSFFNSFSRYWEDEFWFKVAFKDYPRKHYEKAQLAAAEALLGRDPHNDGSLDEALFFWAPAGVKTKDGNPVWAKKLRVFQIPGVERWRFAAYPNSAGQEK